MHVLFVERHGLEETEIPTDLNQTGADPVSYTHLTLPTIYSV